MTIMHNLENYIILLMINKSIIINKNGVYVYNYKHYLNHIVRNFKRFYFFGRYIYQNL